MTPEEQRICLIRTLAGEMPQYRKVEIPEDEAGQKQLIRALMNVRPPLPPGREFLEIQDTYLRDEIMKRGIVDASSLAPVKEGSRIFLWQGDITRLRADAIVNAANSALLGCFHPLHSCIDNAIHSFSGIQLRLACNEIMRAQGHEEPTGTAKITPGYNLPSRYVLHTVGPVISGPLREKDCCLLADCYRSCLELAVKSGIRSIAFCCISTGVFQFPRERAAETAIETVAGFLEGDKSLKQVIFNVFADLDLAVYRRLLELSRRAV